jgi:hypothetical protein
MGGKPLSPRRTQRARRGRRGEREKMEEKARNTGLFFMGAAGCDLFDWILWEYYPEWNTEMI